MINEIGRLYEPEECYILSVLYPSHQIIDPITFLWVQQRCGNQGEKFFSLFCGAED